MKTFAAVAVILLAGFLLGSFLKPAEPFTLVAYAEQELNGKVLKIAHYEKHSPHDISRAVMVECVGGTVYLVNVRHPYFGKLHIEKEAISGISCPK